jgi:hypothetical protein
MHTDKDLFEHSRPDLVCYVIRQCVPIPEEKMTNIHEMREWCRQQFGDDRPGSILMESMEGWLDYFDGDWSDFPNELDTGQYLFWFAKKDDLALFTLTWL